MEKASLKHKNWGERAKGVIYRFVPEGKEVALTLDACGIKGDGADFRIIRFVLDNQIPAMVFTTPKWIKAHYSTFIKLNRANNISVQNHGWYHIPSSVGFRQVYGVTGTTIPLILRRDVNKASKYINKITGKTTHYFRSGCAYYDNNAVKIINSLNHKVVGFDVVGDAGCTYSVDDAAKAVESANSGSIIIAHINHPEREAGEGVVIGLKHLLKNGYKFIDLSTRNHEISKGEVTFKYNIEVWGDISANISEFKSCVSKILNSELGWSRAGVKFIESKKSDFTIVIASPVKVAEASPICHKDYSCRVGNYVIINDDRWTNATKNWDKTLREYRRMVINHEVGHWLGFIDNNSTPPDKIAPVMMQQSISFKNAVSNPWPTDLEIAELANRL